METTKNTTQAIERKVTTNGARIFKPTELETEMGAKPENITEFLDKKANVTNIRGIAFSECVEHKFNELKKNVPTYVKWFEEQSSKANIIGFLTIEVLGYNVATQKEEVLTYSISNSIALGIINKNREALRIDDVNQSISLNPDYVATIKNGVITTKKITMSDGIDTLNSKAYTILDTTLTVEALDKANDEEIKTMLQFGRIKAN